MIDNLTLMLGGGAALVVSYLFTWAVAYIKGGKKKEKEIADAYIKARKRIDTAKPDDSISDDEFLRDRLKR